MKDMPAALVMSLATRDTVLMLRHGVFADEQMVDFVARRLTDAEEIGRSRQFPYQFLAAYLNVTDEVPQKIRVALHRAAEVACGNVPVLPGPVVIGLDVSGSMQSGGDLSYALLVLASSRAPTDTGSVESEGTTPSPGDRWVERPPLFRVAHHHLCIMCLSSN